MIETKIATMAETVRATDEFLLIKILAQDSQIETLEKNERSPNAILFGVEESLGEGQLIKVKSILAPSIIVETRRLGRAGSNTKRPRPVLIRFATLADKHAAYKKAKTLRQELKINMDDDLTKRQRERRAAMMPQAVALKEEGWSTFWRGEHLFKVKGQGPPVKVITGQQASTPTSTPITIA